MPAATVLSISESMHAAASYSNSANARAAESATILDVRAAACSYSMAAKMFVAGSVSISSRM